MSTEFMIYLVTHLLRVEDERCLPKLFEQRHHILGITYDVNGPDYYSQYKIINLENSVPSGSSIAWIPVMISSAVDPLYFGEYLEQKSRGNYKHGRYAL